LIVVAALVSAGIAYAAVSTLVGSDSNSTPPAVASSPPAQATQATTRPAWLGVKTESVAAAGGGFSSGSGTGGTGGTGSTGGGFTTAGVVVTSVVPGSPADAAGLQPGDVITQIDSQTVNSPDEVNSALAAMHAGQQVVIQYQRGPFANTAQVTLATQPNGSP
jgi:S1-C subfamily serine protease